MKYLLVIILLLAGCSGKKEDYIKTSMSKIEEVKIKGMECLIVTEYFDGSGLIGITCDWRNNEKEN